MNSRACHNFIRRLNTDSLQKEGRGLFVEAEQACEVGEIELMAELAQTAQQVVGQNGDQVGESVALIYQGMAWVQMGQFDRAVEKCLHARHICRRNPGQQHSGGLIAYGLGLIFQHRGGRVNKVVGYYREALGLLEQAKRAAAAAGDGVRFRELQDLCQDIDQQITCQVTPVYVDADERGPDPVETVRKSFKPPLDLLRSNEGPLVIGGGLEQGLDISFDPGHSWVSRRRGERGRVWFVVGDAR